MINTAIAQRGVDIQALMHALPVSGLEPQCLVTIKGLSGGPIDRPWMYTVDMLEPPAGHREPYIEPLGALEKLLRHQGFALTAAKACATHAVATMKADTPLGHWVTFFDDIDPDSPECLPLPDFLAWLRNHCQAELEPKSSVGPLQVTGQALTSEVVQVSTEILDFFERAADVAATTPTIRGPDNWPHPWSLQNLPALPPPKAMIEFVPGPPWDDSAVDWESEDNPFLRWRESMRLVANELEQSLGEAVYSFKNLGDDLDHDDVHRFLVLHWCCTHKPKSTFVRFILKVSGAKDVEELKAALIDPANYTHPFRMNRSFIGIETVGCHLNYLPPGVHKAVGVVFLTRQARPVAESLLAQQIGANALLVAPSEIAPCDWASHATRHCRSWGARWVDDGKVNIPIEILASVDELFVIANEPVSKSGQDLKLSETVEVLLWLALDLGIKAKYYRVDHTHLMNPEACLQAGGAPERAAALQAHRAAFTGTLKEIRVDNDFCSSGLWDEKGHMLGYDLLDLPFSLVQRIVKWQHAYDETLYPSSMDAEARWERHEHDEMHIAKELQSAIGDATVVKLLRNKSWINIDGIAHSDRH